MEEIIAVKTSEQKQSTSVTPWTKTEVMYQIYPKSFFDSTGKKGTGDLRGITQKFDYIKNLGVNGIWLSPIFSSPMKDNGYDVSDYCAINPLYGTLEDFDELVREAHQRDLKVMLDFVPNHTSYIHPWFLESSSSRDNPKREWYIWRDPKPDGSPPNNWISVAGGSAWEYHEPTNQYYLHSFLKEQPDLNWWHGEVVEAMKETLRFWLRRGVDGFRMDVFYYLLKDQRFLDEPVNPHYKEGIDHPNEILTHIYSKDQPETLALMGQLADVLDEFENKFMVSETYVDTKRTAEIYTTSQKGLHAPFNFSLIFTRWGAQTYKQAIDEFQDALTNLGRSDHMPVYAIGNHDQSRIARRLGGEKQARIASLLQLTLPGMAFIYYGDEIGMKDVPIPKEKSNDVFGVNRDSQRTPMQWDRSDYAGFSKVAPWLPVSEYYQTRNVWIQERNSISILELYKRLIYMRSSPIFQKGTYERLHLGKEHILAFKRTYDQEEILIALNFSIEEQELVMEDVRGQLLVNTSLNLHPGDGYNLSSFPMFPLEGYVFLIEK